MQSLVIILVSMGDKTNFNLELYRKTSLDKYYKILREIIVKLRMLKLRLKRCGRKRKPAYRIVAMENRTKRDGEKSIIKIKYYF